MQSTLKRDSIEMQISEDHENKKQVPGTSCSQT